jgi:3-phenylpropionate/trans-cinnamate dioxygenase ferredoxin component
VLHFVADYEVLRKEFKKRVVIDELPVLVIFLDEKIYAIQDKCPHMGASLAEGSLDSNVIQCKKHGAKFNIQTGTIVKKAQVGFIKLPTKKPVIFKTLIENGKVYLEL